ncbi:MAG: competence/damage-inducible protein A [Candidatus Coatesbacteria bacterium]|nr:MAG: competence/damage-inducible protein A [Candidatus Coatesbacteria bacterium]
MEATIIAIGDELLLGKTVNNNAAYLSARLAAVGIGTRRQMVVGDRDDEIVAALEAARELAAIAVTTGGLGPTEDDRTLAAVASHLGRELVLHQPTLREIERRFARRGLTMPAVNVGQASVPAGARVLSNPLGTAPGLILEEEGFLLCLLPGVPAEMEYIFEHGFLPYLEKKGYAGERVLEKLLHATGLPESAVAERLAGVEVPAGLHLAFLPQAAQVDLRIWGTASDEGNFAERARPVIEAVRRELGEYIFGEDGTSLEEVVGELLGRRGETVAVAESCTGGLLAKRLTDVPGASAWFLGGVVAYANEAKTSLLGVPEETLVAHGAVSEEVARALAAGARERFGATYALAATGIAGPSGGTAEKPVGMVCLALAGADGVASTTQTFGGGRGWVRRRASQYALEMLRRHLREGER